MYLFTWLGAINETRARTPAPPSTLGNSEITVCECDKLPNAKAEYNCNSFKRINILSKLKSALDLPSVRYRVASHRNCLCSDWLKLNLQERSHHQLP